MAPRSLPSDPLEEALLYVEWLRGAGGRFLPAAEAPPRGPAAVPVAAAPGSTSSAGLAFPALAPTGAAPALSAAGPVAVAALGLPVPGARQVAPASGPVDPARWAPLEAEVAACTRCGLCSTRTQTVFGAGARAPRLVVVGEAPGAEEDRQGLPFVGAAGDLLTRMLAAIGLSREHDVYILNVLKCRPPENRPPRPEEVAACKPFLREQLALLGPPLLLALGNHACRALLQTERGITSLRGRFTTTPEGYRVMPTFHPAYLLRNPEAKREVWEDLKAVAKDLGLR